MLREIARGHAAMQTEPAVDLQRRQSRPICLDLHLSASDRRFHGFSQE